MIRFEAGEATPDVAHVLRRQRLPEQHALSVRVRATLEEAVRLERELAAPDGVFDEISADEFAVVYRGEGCNPPESPLLGIFPKAEALAVFAATLGEAVSARIRDLFQEHDLALAYLLDALASEAADRLSHRIAGHYLESLRQRGLVSSQARALAYSPGYCGWHVSGQARLFERLRPSDVGITLNDSFLMTPLKSVSGVLVAGPQPIHEFRPDFAFCPSCATHECRARWRALPDS